MNRSWSLMNWSFSIGRVAGADLRVHWLLPVVLFWLFTQHSPAVALLLAGALTLSVFLHELGHAFAGRALGLRCSEIQLWPLGGLAHVETSGVPQDDFRVSVAGPLVNAVLLVAMLPLVALWSTHWPFLFNPTQLQLSDQLVQSSPAPPPAEKAEVVESDKSTQPSLRADSTAPESTVARPVVQAAEVLFQVNWMLLLVNLLPAVPFDGGRMLKSWLMARASWRDPADLMFKVAIGTGIALALLGMLFLSNTVVMGLGLFVLGTAVIEQHRAQADRGEESGFMGYDFSEGYTSLERSSVSSPTDADAPAGTMQRWREQRQATRQLREQQDAEREEAELDALLGKVHQQGMDALTATEKQTLYNASRRLQQRTGRSRPGS